MSKGTQLQMVGFAPRLLRRERAAAYLDVSPNTFDRMVKDGVVPPPKLQGGFKWWDRADLDSFADHLPYAAAPAERDTSWDS